jgi:hypothetical protein
MSRLMLLIAALSVCAISFAKPPKIQEPACCKGKTCKHVVGESKKHHKCNAKCHDKHQKKGTCCRGHKH